MQIPLVFLCERTIIVFVCTEKSNRKQFRALKKLCNGTRKRDKYVSKLKILSIYGNQRTNSNFIFSLAYDITVDIMTYIYKYIFMCMFKYIWKKIIVAGLLTHNNALCSIKTQF